MKRKAHGGAGSGSDGEATAGEMSDGAGPKKKIKIKSSGGKGTPSASRAGSPNPPRGSKCQALAIAYHGIFWLTHVSQACPLVPPVVLSSLLRFLRRSHLRASPLASLSSSLPVVLEKSPGRCLNRIGLG